MQKDRRAKSYGQPFDFKIGSKHRDMTPNRMGQYAFYEGAPMIDTKTFKQNFLAGDKEVVMYCDPNEPKSTSYTSTMKGL